MVFLPRDEILHFEELYRLAGAFIQSGVRRIRLTGGEPLVRTDICDFVEDLSGWLHREKTEPGLDELTMTTNASQLARYAERLARAGMRRINVSLDTLDAERFKQITRVGKLERTLEGIRAAREAGMKVRINTVALRGFNEDEFDDLISWCGQWGMDLCLIETMPLGKVENRVDHYLPLVEVKERLSQKWELVPSSFKTAGPARYMTIKETGQRIGFITPLTHGFCESCNRVRLSCTGMLYMCLGQDDSFDFKELVRQGADEAQLREAIKEALKRKPRGHDFVIDRKKGMMGHRGRHMSVTGG